MFCLKKMFGFKILQRLIPEQKMFSKCISHSWALYPETWDSYQGFWRTCPSSQAWFLKKQGDKSQEQAKRREIFFAPFCFLEPFPYLFLFIQNILTSPNSSTSSSISLVALTRGSWSFISAFWFLRSFPKIVNFHRTEGYCTKKWDRISPEVYWCCQM